MAERKALIWEGARDRDVIRLKLRTGLWVPGGEGPGKAGWKLPQSLVQRLGLGSSNKLRSKRGHAAGLPWVWVNSILNWARWTKWTRWPLNHRREDRWQSSRGWWAPKRKMGFKNGLKILNLQKSICATQHLSSHHVIGKLDFCLPRN